ncbi:cell division cycle 5-like protein [Durio zibethinus]|uniref:Cell division cycle 5-like protein n=1 Tax=Durio zibethinus TaxID=66656 RepID=A0A6P5Z0C8_DURZI|nr:cell division cycle 5-like protein [Durio zibethinus]
MRIMIKGGVWKNTEDEILKAAVMKYGKNQWARISSLLVRKSAKQCKARWYEWLDPSIKKTEWTREEDEKLLHLAKLMPTQWRTIAPIVGRTPSQCLERYEKLLDAACARDENYEPGDDPRKLRPGEIDPNPESKPARPDPVDMDEDEKEMLSEARARLANTRGKKAKRKAREKQLEEARRLASLQKRRELKAAGIDTRRRKRKRKGIDYNAEIPFEKRPPPGFYDVADEDRTVEQPKFPTTIEELEGKRRVDIEAQLRKQDIAKNKIAQRQDAPSAILQSNKLNDPETVRKRSKLMLPEPQISNHELEEIAKMGYASDLLAGNEELAEGSGATRALLANYSQTPRQGMTPLRTPQRTPSGKGDAIMMEAENLARLRESQTPLLGGENPELHPSDFSGVTPKSQIQTPNPMTPLATPGGAGFTPRTGMTPSRDGYSYGMTPKGTPIRDELHINEDMDLHDSAKLEQRRQIDLRRNLRSGLSSLPQPKNEYQIVIQPPPEDNEEPEEKIEEDMSDRIARERAEEEVRQQALLKKRSKVLQRELPRPPSSSLELIRDSLMRTDGDKSSFVPPTSIEQADEMIRKELLSLLEHDNAKYPLDEKANKGKKKGSKRPANGSIPSIEDFEEDEMKEADSLIKEEAEFLCVAMGHENESLDDFMEAHNTCLNDLMYFPTRNAYGLSSVAGNMEKLVALQAEFDNVKKKMDNDKLKAESMEKKFNVLTQGYERRAATLWRQIESTFKQMDPAGTELECFQALQKQERLAASHRINGLWEEVQKQKELEQTLQRRYGNLTAELERIQNLTNVYRVQAQKLEEAAEKDRALELSEAAASQAAVPISGLSEPTPSSEHVDSSLDGQPSLKVDMNVDSGKEPASMDMETDGGISGNVPLVVEDKGDNTTKTLNGMTGDASSEVAAESTNPDSFSTKQESIQEKLEGEGFTDHTKANNSSVLGGDTAEKQTGMEE